MIDPDNPRDLFVSSVEGQPVARYGSSPVQIGCHRSSQGYVFDTELVVMIPADEAGRYFREYNQAIREESLRVRSREEWEAQNARHAQQPKADPATVPAAGNQE